MMLCFNQSRKTLSILFLFFCFFSVSYGIEDDLKTFDIEKFYANSNGYTYKISDLESMSVQQTREFYYTKKDAKTPYSKVYRYHGFGKIIMEYSKFYDNILLINQYDEDANIINVITPDIAVYPFSINDLTQLVLEKYQINIMNNEDAKKYYLDVSIYKGMYTVSYCLSECGAHVSEIVVDGTTGEIKSDKKFNLEY